MSPGRVIHRATVIHMPNLNHVYLTAHGSYTSGSWVGEAAQIGVRLGFAPTADAPDKGDIWTVTEGGDIAADYGTQTGTHGSLAKTWTARVGGVGSTENMDAGAQIDMAEDMWTFLNTIKTQNNQYFRWTHVKIAAVDPTGKIPRVASVYTFTTPLQGVGSLGLPPQNALALSTRANLVGRRGRGRIYLPALATGVIDGEGKLATSVGTACQAAFKTLIDNLQSQPGLTQHLPILFVGSADSATVVRPVEIRTGNRLDTIQSRRRQVAESYTVTAL